MIEGTVIETRPMFRRRTKVDWNDPSTVPEWEDTENLRVVRKP